MGATVVYTSRWEKPGDAFECVGLNELLARADIVSLHLPLSDETAKMIDATSLARMKPGAIPINAARGGLVDEDALVAALNAGLDTFAEETPPTNALLALNSVAATPNTAWLTPETLARSLDISFANCRRARDSEPL